MNANTKAPKFEYAVSKLNAVKVGLDSWSFLSPVDGYRYHASPKHMRALQAWKRADQKMNVVWFWFQEHKADMLLVGWR